ncbi:hypothetical protein EMIT0194P_80018 [Pseudomonas serbica]
MPTSTSAWPKARCRKPADPRIRIPHSRSELLQWGMRFAVNYLNSATSVIESQASAVKQDYS